MYNILIVDDMDNNRDLLVRRLEHKAEYRLLIAEDGNAALEVMKSNEVDLVLLDYTMPQKNGREVLEEMQKCEKLKYISVIMISTASDIDKIVECIAHGADDYLIKPINTVLLHARIKNCLEKRKFFIAYQNSHIGYLDDLLKIQREALTNLQRHYQLIQKYASNTQANYLFAQATQTLEQIISTNHIFSTINRPMLLEDIKPVDLLSFLPKINLTADLGKVKVSVAHFRAALKIINAYCEKHAALQTIEMYQDEHQSGVITFLCMQDSFSNALDAANTLFNNPQTDLQSLFLHVAYSILRQHRLEVVVETDRIIIRIHN